MYFVIYPNKDNVISDCAIQGTAKTGSNQGRSEVLELFVLPAVSSSATFGKSRVLLQFDISELSQSIIDGSIPSSGVTYKLRMKDAPHAETLPQSFDLTVHPVTNSWDEGRGLAGFDEKLLDGGYSNWDNATSLISWNLTGSDYDGTISGTQHFDFGDEDLEIDVSSIVERWIASGSNNGLVLKYLDAHETGSLKLFTKKFFSRHAHKPERTPRLEALWEDTVQDDRGNMNYSVTGSLFYYRFIDGFPQNAGGTVYVDIVDSGSNVVQTITSSLNKTGIYEASGVFVTHTSSTQVYRDVWFTDSEQLFTGTFAPTFMTGSKIFKLDDIVVDLPNIKRTYHRGQTLYCRVFARPLDYKPSLVRSGSIEPSPIYFKEAYYEIVNEKTKEVMVPFSTGSIKFSKLSYDAHGNYFEVKTNNLVRGGLYRIKIRAEYTNQVLIFDENWTLKIE